MKKIPLSQGKFALVDDCDFEALSQHKWYARKHRNTFYALRNIRVGDRYTTVQMHRVILRAELPQQIDHKNRNGLNNTRKNLRFAPPGKNRINARRNKNNTSGFKGVSFVKPRNKWQAYINADGARIYLGLFPTPQEAHTAYSTAARKHHGEFARVA